MHLFFSLLMAATTTDQPVVDVFLPPLLDRNVIRTFGRARGIVEEAYADIGVRVNWHSTSSLPPDCAKSPMRRRIVFDLRAGVAGRTPGALAFANPYSQQGPCVTLLMDPLRAGAERNPETTGVLLGHALAHEIGHVLQGVDRHSETGLMKERWSVKEINDMWRTRLRFTAYDAELILDPFRPSP